MPPPVKYATEEERRAGKRAYGRMWRAKHRDEQNAKRRLRNRRLPDEDRAHSLRRNYGISLADYERMATGQQGRCAICRELPGKKRLHVDHNHETGKVRGLLCSKCNTGLGLFRDRAGLLHLALEYLAVHDG
jgi:hypothetical protein